MNDFPTIETQSLDRVTGGSLPKLPKLPGPIGVITGLLSGDPQVNTNVQTGSNNQNNNNTGSGNQTITNNP